MIFPRPIFSRRFRFIAAATLVFAGALILVPDSRAAPRAYRAVRMFGVDYVDAREFGQRFGLSSAWVVAQKQLRLSSKWTEIVLSIHSVEATLNGVKLFLSEPVVVRDGQLYLSRGDAENLFAPILSPAAKSVPPLRTIAIDAGHGGSDPGNQNRALRLDEKVFTLDVARRLERLLVARGYRVIMTRTADRTLDLDHRPALANQARADLFISIHFNGFSDPAVAGAETYVMTPHRHRSSPQAERDRSMAQTLYPSNQHDHWNALLGYRMHRALTDRLKAPDRGLKRFRYSVLRSVECPAVLVEAAFLSNPAEGKKVATAGYRQQIAEAIASGVTEYGAALDRLRRKAASSG